ncbi:MAG: FGGY family carbohydrate kinase, partial [Terricaulis sp.]
MSQHILAIDQGTTSTRAIVFDLAFQPQATAQVELQQHYPQPGWVEHDAEEIWAATLKVCRDSIQKAGGVANIAAIGITNQRETTVVWDRKTGTPVH